MNRNQLVYIHPACGNELSHGAICEIYLHGECPKCGRYVEAATLMQMQEDAKIKEPSEAK